MILIHPIQHPKAKQYLHFISLSFLIYIAYTLLWSVPLNGLGIILFAVSVLVTNGIVGMYQNFTRQQFFFILLYLLHVIGLLYTSNVVTGGFDLEKKLSLIVFPLFLGRISLTRTQVHYVIFAFVFSCFAMLTYLFAVAGIKLYLLNTNKYFLISRLTGPVGIHRVYFSMYLVFAIVASIYLIKNEFYKYRYFLILVILLFSIGIFLMSARMCFLIYLILVARYLYYYFFVEKKIWLGILVVAIAATSIGTIITNKTMMEKLTQIYKGLDTGNSKRNTSSANLRVIKWGAAIEVFKNNWSLGTGTGDGNDELVKEYYRRNFYWGIKDKYNAHNQYFEIALALGVVGLLVWILNLVVPFYWSIKAKKYLYAEFILIFALCCLTESMLNAQKGVVFYAFFNSLFLFQFLPAKAIPSNFKVAVAQ